MVMKYTEIRQHLKPINLANGIFVRPTYCNKDDQQVLSFLIDELSKIGLSEDEVRMYDSHKLKKDSLVVEYNAWARENPWIEIHLLLSADQETGSWSANYLTAIEIPASVRFYYNAIVSH